MKAYKGFDRDLKCRGYQFYEDKVHTEPEANCVKNGFHCAEDPLDCLTYYPNWENSVYYIVEASGDIDEDGTDTKISCTEMTLVKKLNLEEFVHESLEYMKRYPLRKCNTHVSDAASPVNSFIVTRGKRPIAAGAIGSVLGLVREEGNKVVETAVVVVDGMKIKENIWYTILDGRLIAEAIG